MFFRNRFTLPRASACVRALFPLIVLLVAGCAGTADPPSGEGRDDPFAREESTTLEACTLVEALTKLPAATVRAFLPAGFEPADEAGVFTILGGGECETGGARAFVAIQVEPVSALAEEGITRYYFEPEHHLVAGGAFAEQVLALRANATFADVAVENGPTRGSLVVAGTDWQHEVALPLGAAAPGPAGMITAGRFREYFPAVGGYAYLDASFAVDPTTPFTFAPSEVTTGEATIAREIFGSQAQIPAGVARLSYANAIVGFVPYP